MPMMFFAAAFEPIAAIAAGGGPMKMMPSRAQSAAKRQPVFTWKHQIEHDEVDPSRVQCVPHGSAVGDGSRPQAVLEQIFGQQPANFSVVIDDQDMVGRVHGAILEWFRAGKAREK